MNKVNQMPLKLFGFYQSISDDLVFWCIFDVLILSLVKGFSALEISVVFTVSYWASIILQFPSYYLSKKLKPGGSIIFGATLFLLAAVLITFGHSLPVIIIGQSLYRIAASFQKMSLVILKNAVNAGNQNDKYLKVMAAANSIYSAISLVTAVTMSWLFQINRILPMYICIGICTISLCLSLVISRYDEKKETISMDLIPGRRIPILDKTTIFCLILSVLGLVIFALSENNLRILMEKDLSELFGAEKEVFLFSLVMIGSRASKLLGNAISFFSRYDGHKRILVFSSMLVLTVSIPVLGLISVVFSGLASVILVGAGILIKAAVFDTYKVYLSYFLMSRLKKNKMIMVLFIDSLAVNLFNSIFSSIVTLLISFRGMVAVMFFLSFLGLILLTCYILFNKYLIRNNMMRGFHLWKEEDYIGIDQIITAATVLIHQYNIGEPTPASVAEQVRSVEMIDAVSKHIHFNGYYKYTEEKLNELYQKGYPCAIYVKPDVDSKSVWLPVIYMDKDGGIVWNYGSYNIFINQFPEITQICSFVIS